MDPLQRHSRCADAWWRPAERLFEADELWLRKPPDLVVEVRSPGTWRFDTGAKKAAYFAAGVTEQWLLNTASETVLVFRTDGTSAEVGEGEILASLLLPELAIDVAALFAAGRRTR